MTKQIHTPDELCKIICADSDECYQIPGHPKYFAIRSGFIISIASGKPKIIIGCKCGQMGYRAITFLDGSRQYIHAIICEAWNGPRPSPKHQVRHLDGKLTNNAADNLQWGTAKENAADKLNHGTNTSGIKNPMAKLTPEKVLQMRKCREQTGLAYKNIAKNFNISTMTAFRAVTGRAWK